MLDISSLSKTVSAETAISNLKNGSHIFIGSGCGEPQHLIHALVDAMHLQDVIIFQMLSFAFEKYLQDESFLRRFALKLFFVTNPMRQAAVEGKIDYIPVYLSEIPRFFRNNQICLDAALIQISPPDRFGHASLGVSVDVTREAVRHAKVVIAQVNPRMPRTHGDSFLHIDDIDYLVPYEEELLEHGVDAEDEEIAQRIARHVAELVDDGSTLQMGYGPMPYAVLKYLDHKNDLGVHTHMISDAFIPLLKKGVITNKRKNYFTDRTVATFCMGSRETYDYIDDNPKFYFGTADLVNNPRTVAQNDNFISISSALEVDLTGQVCSDSAGREFFSGTGDQANFIRGAALSRGGLSIIALPSTAQDGSQSRIVANFSEGAGLATLRADVNFVVTEYGIAQLKGKSIRQRVIELAQIAHPQFREELIKGAKRNRHIFIDQLPPPALDLMFIEEYKSRFQLKDHQTISVRPLLPSDEIAYRNFLYSLQEQTVYLRFFHNIHVFSRQMVQKHWAQLDYRKNLSMIGLVRRKGNKEIVAIGTYAALGQGDDKDKEDKAYAEVAFVTREDFQGMGVGAYLLKELARIAAQNGYNGFTAFVLPQNKPMLHLFKKIYPHAAMDVSDGEVRVVIDF